MSDFCRNSARWFAQEWVRASASKRTKIEDKVRDIADARPHKARWGNLERAMAAGDELRMLAYIGEVDWSEVRKRDADEGRPGGDKPKAKAKTKSRKATGKAKKSAGRRGGKSPFAGKTQDELLSLLNALSKEIKTR